MSVVNRHSGLKTPIDLFTRGHFNFQTFKRWIKLNWTSTFQSKPDQGQQNENHLLPSLYTCSVSFCWELWDGDMEGWPGDVLVAPFHSQNVVPPLLQHITDVILRVSNVLHQDLLTGRLRTMNAHQEHVLPWKTNGKYVFWNRVVLFKFSWARCFTYPLYCSPRWKMLSGPRRLCWDLDHDWGLYWRQMKLWKSSGGSTGSQTRPSGWTSRWHWSHSPDGHLKWK